MRAMVLAAGFGTRLGELTKNTPKCLMEVGGCTLLEHAIERLREAGVTDIVVNTHYLSEQVESFIASRDFGPVRVITSYEESLLGTGGGLQKVRDFFQAEPYFLVYNSDIYCEADLRPVVQAHVRTKATATLVVLERNTSRPLLFDTEGCLQGWENLDKSTGKCYSARETLHRMGFSGIHVISPDYFALADGEEYPFSILTPYFKAVKAGQAIRSFNITGSYWIDAGVPERLERLHNHLMSKVRMASMAGK